MLFIVQLNESEVKLPFLASTGMSVQDGLCCSC